jgi:hypothetical protein
MIKPCLKVADTLAYDYGSSYPRGTRVIYDSIKADHDCDGGVAVRIVEPFKRPVWITACYLSSYRRLKGENGITQGEVTVIMAANERVDKLTGAMDIKFFPVLQKEDEHGKDQGDVKEGN